MGKLRFKVRYFFLPFGGETSRRHPHRKGIGFIFPNRDADIWLSRKGGPTGVRGASSLRQVCGNANELGDAGGSPGKSSLFFLTQRSALESDYLEIGHNVRQSTTLLVVSGALSTALENPRERMIFVPGRTDNRSRSPR